MRVITIILLALLYGCCAISTTDKFESARNYWMGQKLSDPWFKTFVDDSEYQTDLGLGDVEYYYTRKQCKYSMVINSNTQIVKSWKYRDNSEYCAVSNCSAW